MARRPVQTRRPRRMRGGAASATSDANAVAPWFRTGVPPAPRRGRSDRTRPPADAAKEIAAALSPRPNRRRSRWRPVSPSRLVLVDSGARCGRTLMDAGGQAAGSQCASPSAAGHPHSDSKAVCQSQIRGSGGGSAVPSRPVHWSWPVHWAVPLNGWLRGRQSAGGAFERPAPFLTRR